MHCMYITSLNGRKVFNKRLKSSEVQYQEVSLYASNFSESPSIHSNMALRFKAYPFFLKEK